MKIPKKWQIPLKGEFSYFFDFFVSTDINSKAYCKTHHVARMLNFNPEMTYTGFPNTFSGNVFGKPGNVLGRAAMTLFIDFC